MNCPLCTFLDALNREESGHCAKCRKAICPNCKNKNHLAIADYTRVLHGWYHDECIPRHLWGPRIRCENPNCSCRERVE